MRVKQYRKDHFMTQKQLAELIGISVNYIGTLEKGKRKARASTIAAFEEAVQRYEIEKKRLEMMNVRGEEDRLKYMKVLSELKKLDPETAKTVLERFYCVLDWAKS